jgi:peptidoglycan/LPS O-acetylase OafA/YrhL
MRHIKQLDSIRALAVLLVIISHWLPKLNILPWGEIGVDIFFVLSGFLISAILFENKKAESLSLTSKPIILRNFIARRTLRIFPVYYLVVIVHYFAADYTGTSVQENIGYYLLYASNILFFITQKLDGIASHFWSLAVEEQFYLVWPWVILFCNYKYIPHVLLGSVIIGTVFPIIFPLPHIGKLTPSCLNAFAIGATLAYIRSENGSITDSWNKYLDWIVIILVLTLPLCIFYPQYPLRLSVSIIAVW